MIQRFSPADIRAMKEDVKERLNTAKERTHLPRQYKVYTELPAEAVFRKALLGIKRYAHATDLMLEEAYKEGRSGAADEASQLAQTAEDMQGNFIYRIHHILRDIETVADVLMAPYQGQNISEDEAYELNRSLHEQLEEGYALCLKALNDPQASLMEMVAHSIFIQIYEAEMRDADIPLGNPKKHAPHLRLVSSASPTPHVAAKTVHVSEMVNHIGRSVESIGVEELSEGAYAILKNRLLGPWGDHERIASKTSNVLNILKAIDALDIEKENLFGQSLKAAMDAFGEGFVKTDAQLINCARLANTHLSETIQALDNTALPDSPNANKEAIGELLQIARNTLISVTRSGFEVMR